MVNRLQCEVFRTHGFAPCRIPADRIEQTVVSESTTSRLYFRRGRQELRPRRSFDTLSLLSQFRSDRIASDYHNEIETVRSIRTSPDAIFFRRNWRE